MNRIILIGNGFDMAHGLKTSYEDFIKWYWTKRVYGFRGLLHLTRAYRFSPHQPHDGIFQRARVIDGDDRFAVFVRA